MTAQTPGAGAQDGPEGSSASHGTHGGPNGSSKTLPPRTPVDRKQLEADVVRTRTELAATIDELTTRLSPRYQASHLVRSTKQAAEDAGSMVAGIFTRQKNPAPDERRVRNVKILVGATLGLVALGAAAVAAAALRRARG
ncbi:DUF3618 domain-containing protein [Antribacter sp. KLBMP9083]|uniref:DUF3618 domain-containing protein n=1 Tax=Antribacter soli TaxID=2910976 RepID=A0AA41QCI4_9MICO|nr:DUF3618 domain-containing protein [Antribacter soli]MCF4119634.1 DUF3618 domain-containing protein [Antribacter soli]